MVKVHALVRTKFGIETDDLDVAMRKIGRRLPRSAHRHAAQLVEFQTKSAHPKLRLNVDPVAFAKSYRGLMHALQSYDPSVKRMDLLLGTLASVAFNLIVVFALFVIVLKWRGFL